MDQDKPIFYDPTHERWWKIKYFFVFLAICFFILCIGFLAIIYQKNAIRPLVLPPVYHLSAIELHDSVIFSIEDLFDQTISQIAPIPKIIADAPVPKNHFNIMVNVDNGYLNFQTLRPNISKIDIVLGDWLNLDVFHGKVVEQAVEDQKLLVDFVRSHHAHTKIIPVLQNVDNTNISDILASSPITHKIIQHLFSYVTAHHYQGIAIDLTGFFVTDKDNFTHFIQDLAQLFHRHQLLLIVKVPVDDDAFDYSALAQVADFEVLQAYDEHADTDEAGPIASLAWFKDAIAKSLTLIPANKLVIAMANYGYDWQTVNSQNDKINIDRETEFKNFQQIMLTAKLAAATIHFDPVSLNPTFNYLDNHKISHQVWFLDAVTLFNQLAVMQGLNSAGLLLDHVGYEDPSVWPVINATNWDHTIADRISTIDADNAVFTPEATKGDIITVKHVPEVGVRHVVYDAKADLIIHEDYLAFPASYLMSNYGETPLKQVALTFDDGPSKYTPEILNTLRATQTPATFFVIGINALSNAAILQRESDEHHEIGNHTFTHPDIAKISHFRLRFEIAATQWLIQWLTGIKTHLFRPPYGIDSAPHSLAEAKPLTTLTNSGYITAITNIDPEDYDLPGANVIVKRVLQQVNHNYGKAIVLHDGGGDRQQTADALPLIIAELKAQGYQFITLAQLLNQPDIQLIRPAHFSQDILVTGIMFEIMHATMSILKTLFISVIIIGIARFIILVSGAIYQKMKENKMVTTPINVSVTAILPVYNEEKVVVKTVCALLESHSLSSFNILIVNDGSTDNTLAVLKQHFADNPQITILDQINSGKTTALQNGLQHATGDIIVTLDGDTYLAPDAITNLIKPFADPQVAAVAGNIKVGNQRNYLTRWQGLEYCTIQNMERRVLSLVDAVVVVPGAIGAWRKSAMLEVGGFTHDTVAEDADLTFKLKLHHYKIGFVNEALGYTEAPDTLRGFIRQRYRWMFGSLQVAWKYKGWLLSPRFPNVGFVALPNIFIFHIFFTLVAPIIDLLCLLSLCFMGLDWYYHPTMGIPSTFNLIIFSYIIFTFTDIITVTVGLIADGKEKLSLLFGVIPQRFFYRQILYFVAIKIFIAALYGKQVWWGRNIRKASVQLENV